MLVKVFAIQREFSVFEKSWSKRLLHLEQEISAWLEANPGIRIIHIKQSCCGGSWKPPETMISIWYEPKG